MSDGLKQIVERLERCIDRLKDPTLDQIGITVRDAQRIVEQLRQPPNQIAMRYETVPVDLMESLGERAWHAEASWGPGDAKTICYGTTWLDALVELATVLKLKEGDDKTVTTTVHQTRPLVLKFDPDDLPQCGECGGTICHSHSCSRQGE